MTLTLDPDRLFPVDPATRDIARSLFARVERLPIVSPHGHVQPSLLSEDQPFCDPADLFIVHDHYVTRLLHAAGVRLEELGVGCIAPADPGGCGALARNWHLFVGTSSGYWLQHEPSHCSELPTSCPRNCRRCVRPHRGRSCDGRVPAACCSSASRSRCSPPPTTRWTTSRARRTRSRPLLLGAGVADLPPRRLPRPVRFRFRRKRRQADGVGGVAR